MLMKSYGSAQYGVILDAGSSGTRVYVYKWKRPIKAIKHATASDAHFLPKLKLQRSKKIHPGVSSFAENVALVGPDHLKSLIDIAVHEIPSSKIPGTPVFLMATAGVRFLPSRRQNALLQTICNYLQSYTHFILPDCAVHVQVISGETEGLYGWIAANYLLGGFDRPELHIHSKGHHTYGFLDMGGASAQIAFSPNSTEAEKHANDLKLVRMRRLDGSSAEYRVFTTSWLGYGANKARERFVKSLQEQYDNAAEEIPDPCMHKGLRTTLTGEVSLARKFNQPDQLLVGTGMFDECLRRTNPLLGKDIPCEDQPCLLNGQHTPAIDFDVNHFVGVSDYWHTTHGVFGKENMAYDLISYQQQVKAYCSRDWFSIKNDLSRHKTTSEQKSETAREACFKASWLINVLYEGIGIPRLGLNDLANQEINTTKQSMGKDKEQFSTPFQPVETIDGAEFTWTLGKMLLYAAGQIPPQGLSLPVGFGSNAVTGIPADFEHAGSVPLLPSTNADEVDNDELPANPSKSTSGLLLLALILLFIGYLLRKPERRRILFNGFWRHRKSGYARKLSRGYSLTSKVLGRNQPTHELITEEGAATELELGAVESDDNEDSDGIVGSRHFKSPRLLKSKLNAERFEDRRPPSAMDWHGFVVRTESCKRLAPSLQKLNAGRRSRAGSPVMLNSPLMMPLQGS